VLAKPVPQDCALISESRLAVRPDATEPHGGGDGDGYRMMAAVCAEVVNDNRDVSGRVLLVAGMRILKTGVAHADRGLRGVRSPLKSRAYRNETTDDEPPANRSRTGRKTGNPVCWAMIAATSRPSQYPVVLLQEQ